MEKREKKRRKGEGSNENKEQRRKKGIHKTLEESEKR
jgi:hypothetical protein